MSRKKTFTEPYEAPTGEQIHAACVAVGSMAEVARQLRKNFCTIDRWCKGKVKIDYANWEMLKQLAEHTTCLNCDSVVYGTVFCDDVCKERFIGCEEMLSYV